MSRKKISPRRGLYPGSFDPVTLGHLDIIRRAAPLFDEFYVAVLVNSAKKALFSAEERVKILQAVTADIPGVRVILFSGLTVDCCRQYGIGTIVRGLRNGADLDYELPIARVNRSLLPEVDTLFLTAEAPYEHISSSIVKEVASYGRDVSAMVPPEVVERMNSRR